MISKQLVMPTSSDTSSQTENKLSKQVQNYRLKTNTNRNLEIEDK